MWGLIGVLVVIGICLVAYHNREGGNSPADWKDRAMEDGREIARTAREHMADYWHYDENRED